MRAVWVLACLAGGTMLDTAAPSQKTVMARTTGCVARYTEELPRLVATETMTQQVTRKLGHLIEVVQRRSVAEFGWVALPGHFEAIGVRDVIEIDGRPVGSGRSRLVDLLHGPADGTWSQARAVLEEGARYNLAPGSRNFNLPTVAMYFLHPDRRTRFSWKRRSSASAPVWELEFRERDRPTVIRTGEGQSVSSHGRVWLEAATGAIIRTDLELEFDKSAYALTTWFEHVAAMELVLPVRLDERYTRRDGVVTGSATYTNYRRFQTGARLLP